MLGPLLDVTIIIDGKPHPDCHFDNLDLHQMKGKCDSAPPALNANCSVLVTREIHSSSVTLELIGTVTEVDGNDFSIEFTNISENTLKQIDSIILVNKKPH